MQGALAADDWYIVLEDDVIMIDEQDVLKQKLSITLCLYPSVEVIYLTGRQVPNFLPGNVVQYLGVDAYALSGLAAQKLLRHTSLASHEVTTPALDAHLSLLVSKKVVDARMILGGNSFANAWSKFSSDIEVGR